jgi:hypothetical protein
LTEPEPRGAVQAPILSNGDAEVRKTFALVAMAGAGQPDK